MKTSCPSWTKKYIPSLLSSIGTGDLYLFQSNTNVQKIELKRRNIPKVIPEQVALRKTPRFAASPLLTQLLAEGDKVATKAVAKLKDVVVVDSTVCRSPRLSGDPPITIAMTPAQLAKQKKGDKTTGKALEMLSGVRRSPRLAKL